VVGEKKKRGKGGNLSILQERVLQISRGGRRGGATNGREGKGGEGVGKKPPHLPSWGKKIQ